jgi:hypothetical protein
MKPIANEDRRVKRSGMLFCVNEQVVPDEGTVILQNFRNSLLMDTVSHPTKVESLAAGAGVYCKLFLQYATVGVNKSNDFGEAEDICLALQQLLYRLQAFEKVAILVD